MTTTPSRRTLLRAAAWTAPAVTVAAAAPAHAASTPGSTDPQLGVRVVGPTEYSGLTAHVLAFTNAGDAAIGSGELVATLRDGGTMPYYFAGFSGSRAWDYGDADPAGRDLTFAYLDPLGPGQETGNLLLIIGNSDRSQTPVPTADLYVTAPGHAVTPVPLSIPF